MPQKHAAPMNLSKRKVNALDDAPLGNDDMNLFVDAPADSDDEDSDSSDSGASSEFSDLEEEEDDSEDEKVLYDESESENEKVATTSEESPVHTPTLMKETSKILVTKNERSKNLENLRRSGNAKKLAKKKGSKPKDGGVDSGNENSGTAGQANSQDDTPNVYPDTPNVYPDTPNVYPDTPNVYPDEYDFDSSDEEDIRNTVGNIPMEWYRDYGHIGYDWEGRKILAQKKGDELDKFLDKMENPDYWRTVKDKSTGQSVLLSEQDIDTIHRIKSGAYPDSSTDPYAPWVDFFSYDTMIHPVSNRPEHKRSFTPSNLERLKVGRMVHAIKMGWMKPRVEKDEDEDEEDELPKYYQLWDEENESEMNKRFRHHIPAPKAALPGHAESYNPPPEYLMTDAEKEAWENQDPVKRRIGFIPQSFSSLRLVPAYRDFIKERFERCLDLYLCPRQRKMRANVNAEDLIPKLPKPRDLQPFPTTQALVYKGHTNLVRTISIDPTGQWFASGSDDATVRFWEITSGRCLKTVHVPGAVKSLAWNPNPGVCIVAVAVENTVFMLNPHLADKVISAATDAMLNLKETEEAEVKNLAQWQTIEGAYYEAGFRMKLVHAKPVSQVTWHGKGDYLATIAPDQQTMSVLIHQLTKQRSQNPFKKSKGLVQKVCFHPTRPFFYVATQRYVRVYNLVKQELIKKLITNCKWVSSMAIHPGGDNVVIGSYDCRLSWFDLDLSTKPYQTLRHHKRAIRQVAFHRKYPLFCSAADDATTIVCHGRVYDDLMQNPLIVPVKVLHGHSVHRDLGVLDCTFHPTQPWLLSAGADATIRLFT